MKKTLLFIILVFSLGVVKAQTWNLLSVYDTVSNIQNTSFDIAIDDNDVIYLAHPGYTSELNKTTKSKVVTVLKYENNQWDTLPNASNYEASNGGGVHFLSSQVKITHHNNALYLFYSIYGILKVKKFYNNQWSDIGDINGYRADFFSALSVLYNAGSKIVCASNQFFCFVDLNIDTVYFQDVNIESNEVFYNTGANDNYIYYLNKAQEPVYSNQYHKKTFITRYDLNTKASQIIYSFPLDFYFPYGYPYEIGFRIVANNANDIYIVLDKYGSLEGDFLPYKTNSKNAVLFKLNNQNLQMLDSSLSNLGYVVRNTNSLGISNDGIPVYTYLDKSKFLNALYFDGQGWNNLGDHSIYEKGDNVFRIIFNSKNEPYIAFYDYDNKFPVIAHLNRSVSVETPTVSSFSVFPNPSNGVFNIHTSENAENINYQIYALDGKKIVEKTNVSAPFSVDISNASNGVYILKVNQNRKSETFKLLKLNE